MFRRYLPTLFLVCFVVILMALRLLPHQPNFSPASALLFFAVICFPNKWGGLLTAALALLGTDMIIGFYPGIEFTYMGYLLIALTGIYFRSTRTNSGKIFVALSFIVSVLSGAVMFFALSNLGVWFSSGMYTKDLPGLVDCYLRAIPFFRATLISHTLYASVFVGAYYFILLPVVAYRKKTVAL